MSLTDKTYFLYPPCEIPITDSSNGYSSSLVEKENTRINLSINIYEREYLKLILGEELYADYILDTKKDSIDREQKWINFEQQLLSFNEIISETVTLKTSPIACYIYCNYMIDNELNITQKATATNDKSQNQTVRSNYPFIKKAWDIMVSYNYTIVEWLLENKDEFEIDNKEYNRNGMAFLLKPQTYGI